MDMITGRVPPAHTPIHNTRRRKWNMLPLSEKYFVWLCIGLSLDRWSGGALAWHGRERRGDSARWCGSAMPHNSSSVTSLWCRWAASRHLYHPGATTSVCTKYRADLWLGWRIDWIALFSLPLPHSSAWHPPTHKTQTRPRTHTHTYTYTDPPSSPPYATPALMHTVRSP